MLALPSRNEESIEEAVDEIETGHAHSGLLFPSPLGHISAKFSKLA